MVASRSHEPGRLTRPEHQPPTKKQKLSQSGNHAKNSVFEDLLSQSDQGKKRLQAASNGFKDDVRLHKLDESRATISVGGIGDDVDMEDAPKDVVEISSDEEESDAESEDSIGDAKNTRPPDASAGLRTELNGVSQGEAEDGQGGDTDEEEPGQQEEPTFGELLQAAAPDPIDVADAMPQSGGSGLITSSRVLSAPSAASLSTVLTQALRTNDQELLESCFILHDFDSVRRTIERLDSSLVGLLLQKISERIHKRPGRASTMMVWVQWSLVAHGGYLASQPDVVRKLSDLQKVMRERASGLQPLLQLKGKLDMLSAQLELRRHIQKTAEVGADEDNAVIYVEGEETDEEEGVGAGERKGHGAGNEVSVNKTKQNAPKYPELGDDSDDGLDILDAAAEADEGEDEEDDDDDEGLLDDAAEETDADTGDDMSEPESEDLSADDEDISDGEDISESEDERPAKRSMVSTRRH
jgi:U3 small nucleolar RNA-associated protein 5